MADPFSAAGTAVGITSLGIQTCQILFRYYSQYRGFHDDIDHVLRRIEGLEGILCALAKVQEKVQIDNYEPSSQLCLALKACEEALERLRKVVERCGANKNVSSYKERLQLATKRAQWPLRREVLMDTSSELEKIQQNLALALQTLGLDLNLQKFDHLASATTEIGTRTSRMENHIIGQCDALQKVQGGLKNLTRYQQEHSSRVSKGLTTISAQGASTDQKLDLIIQTLAQFQNPTTVSPSFLAETIDTVNSTRPRLDTTLKHCIASTHGLKPRNKLTSSPQVCQCRSRKRQSLRKRGWIYLYFTENHDHETHCPRHSHGDFSRTTAAQIIVCNCLLQFCMLVGWQQSRRSGWNSSIPILQYRAVVPSNSPVFLAISETALLKGTLLSLSREELEGELAAIMNSLRKCFRENANPTDIDDEGNGIACALVRLLSELIFFRGSDMDIFISFLDACFEEGIRWDQTDAYCVTPVELAFMTAAIYAEIRSPAVFFHLARRNHNWTIPLQILFHGRDLQRVYDNVSNFLKSEEMYETLDVESPLLESILGRMDSKFSAILMSESPRELVSMLATVQYASPLASWPKGLKILLTNNLMNDHDGVKTQLWKEAMRLINPDSIEILVLHGVQPTILDWFSINKWGLRLTFFWEDSCRYQKVLLHLAKQMRHESLEDVSDTLSLTEPYEARKESSPYHTCCLTMEAVESLWAAGYRDIDKIGWHQLDSDRGFLASSYCTPLWACASESPISWESYRTLMEWFMERGADPFWVHSFHRTTPAHLSIRQAIYSDIDGKSCEERSVALNDVCEILKAPNRDDCCCHCSRGGCTAIGIGSSRHAMENGYGIAKDRERILLNIYHLVDKDSNSRWMSSAILRVLTFEKLSLTHTCCYRIFDEVNGRFTRPTTEEAKVIHDIERDEINLLDNLMVDFEHAWERYPGTFERFVRKVWKPRMRQEQQKKRQPTAEEIFRQTGVKLVKVKKRTEERAQESEEFDDEGTEDDVSEAGGMDEDEGDNTDNDHEDGGYETAAED